MHTVKWGQQLKLLDCKPPPCIQNLEQHELELKCHYTRTTGLCFHLWQLSPRLELRALAGYRGCPRRKDYRRCCHLLMSVAKIITIKDSSRQKHQEFQRCSVCITSPSLQCNKDHIQALTPTPVKAFRRDVIEAWEISIWFVRVHTLKVLHTLHSFIHIH